MQRTNQAEKLGFLVEALALGDAPKALREMETASQTRLVNSEFLPSKLEPEGAKEFLEKAGLMFLDEAVGLFRKVVLPPGWKKVPTNHPWLSMLLDAKGREIARVFYKGTYYDESAALIIQSRYGTWEGEGSFAVMSDEFTGASIAATVIDGGTMLGQGEILFMSQPQPSSTDRRERLRTLLRAKKEAYAWLNENFPDWQNPFAYWV